MKCRYCGKELEQDAGACPECGKKVLRLDAWKIALMAIGGLLILCLMVGVILVDQGVDLSILNPANWFQQDKAPGPEQDADEDPQGIQFVYDLTRESYTASQEDVQTQAAKLAAQVGDLELTNDELQVFYWSGVNDFLMDYQYYLSSMGLDLTQPLDEQEYMDQGITWQRFFLENAVSNWHKYAALALEAKAAGYEMSQSQSQLLESLPTQLETMSSNAGYESVDAMIKTELGPLCSLEGYTSYMQTYYLAVDYFNTQYAQMQPTDQQVEDYFAENEETLASSGITKESKSYDVRHILIEVEGGTTDENGITTYSDAEWEVCRQKAQAVLDRWKAEDGTEEGFAELAKNNSADGGSSSNGGLYTGLTESTNFVQEFKDWYLDESRMPGDTGLVKSTYGYHIMYFSGSELLWKDHCYNQVLLEISQQFVEQAMEKWPITLFDQDIAIGTVEFTAG